MPRRRLQLRYSSDEEEDEISVAPSVQPEPSVASSFNPNPGEGISVSEVEIIDVSGNPTPTPPDSSIPTPYPVDPSGSESEGVNNYASPIGMILFRKGFKLKTDWWVSCLARLESSVPQFSGLNVEAKAKHCFEKFLFSDMNLCGGGVLPRNVASMNLEELAGPFVLQVDEIVNIGSPLKGRYENANAGLKRCLKLSMTDGVQRVFGMEYRPIKDLQVLAPAGLKIVVSSVQVRHGILMLVPEIVEVLGGMVEELEEARKRLVVEVNKPPRGKRTRNGVVPSLATRATLAAWSPDDNATGNRANSSTSENASHAQTNGQGIPSNVRRTHMNPQTMNGPPPSINVEATVSRVEHMQIDTAFPHRERVVSDLHSTSNNIHMTASTACSSGSEMHIDNGRVRETTSPVFGSGLGSLADEEVSNRAVDLEIPSVLSTNAERPFTYLADLSQKWAVMKDTMHSVQGRIKCFLTGVKKFQFKQQSTFELVCYVDDGSLICEILLHNDVVQQTIGHSSMEVSAALSSSASTTINTMMKEKLKRLQLFLADFEGIMVVEISRSSQYPVAIEMTQGCSLTDARLLFERIKSSATTSSHLDPVVVISP
ncbi:unnamed protein product [Arabis nemorensis]|uniref:RecQ-mediated genome instability protein 1 n=1 Tax=Arabis nemorensis TaxID=586526 RepID=A0A565CVX6_9BRAS|nr:unnamed protein product [Arabis nemorensis]